MASKDDLITLRNAQLQDYQDKLDGASPDAAKARIDALEERINQQIAALGPRRVSADQRRAMSTVLDAYQGSVVSICSDAASADAAQMSQGLIAAFNGSGWTVQNGMIMGLGNPPLSGIGIRIANPQQPTPQQTALMRAFEAAGLQYDLQPGNTQRRDNASVPVAEIMLTNRLQD